MSNKEVGSWLESTDLDETMFGVVGFSAHESLYAILVGCHCRKMNLEAQRFDLAWQSRIRRVLVNRVWKNLLPSLLVWKNQVVPGQPERVFWLFCVFF